MAQSLAGKVAVVTGAGGTICSVIATELAAKGAKIALIGRTEEKLQKTADQIRQLGGICVVKPCNVCSEADMLRIAQETEAELGPCNILINGAGGNNMKARTTKPCFDRTDLEDRPDPDLTGFWDLELSSFESVLYTNTLGSVIAMRAFCRQMAKAGGGSVVNFASMNSYCPLTGNPAYAMSKAAIDNFTMWAAAYFAPANIRVNAVAPGFIINPSSIHYLGSPETGLTPRGQKVISHTPMGRFGKSKDIVGAVEFLIDDDAAAFVTGITVPVDGGFLTLSGV